jgi:SAM-dependent methyltransferase
LLELCASRPASLGVAWLDERLYPGVHGHWDDELLRAEVLACLRPEHRLLDLGAGAGIVREMGFCGLAGEVCGLDLDPRVLDNPHLDEARVGSAQAIPWPAESFDVVVADNLLEHLEHPATVLREVERVLRPGGVFLAKTPNRRHYVASVARLSPMAMHRWLNARRGRAREDTFPTLYRANTPSRIAQLATAVGLENPRVRRVESRPEYLRWNVVTYMLGWLWERAVNRIRALEPWRVLLLVRLEKPLGRSSVAAATASPQPEPVLPAPSTGAAVEKTSPLVGESR